MASYNKQLPPKERLMAWFPPVIINLSMVVWSFILQVIARESIAQPIDRQMVWIPHAFQEEHPRAKCDAE